MCDYTSLANRALIELQDNLQAGCERGDQRSFGIETELTRRAAVLCVLVEHGLTVICQIANWSLRVSRGPEKRNVVVLVGQAYGHRDYPNGTPLVTGPLESIVRTADGDLALTLDGIYRLTTVHPDTLRALDAE